MTIGCCQQTNRGTEISEWACQFSAAIERGSPVAKKIRSFGDTSHSAISVFLPGPSTLSHTTNAELQLLRGFDRFFPAQKILYCSYWLSDIESEQVSVRLFGSVGIGCAFLPQPGILFRIFCTSNRTGEPLGCSVACSEANSHVENS